jgi:P27 family predicted phage terminase small subunit
MPGRPKKPTALKRQNGTARKDRTNTAEPQLPPELPAPPDGLDDRVIAAYMAHGKRLLDMRVMTRADVGALVGMAQSWVDWQRALETLAKFVETNGSEYYETGDLIKAHPALGVRNEAERRYRSWCQSFGMTPSDRAKVAAIDSTAEKSPLAKLLEMKRA